METWNERPIARGGGGGKEKMGSQDGKAELFSFYV
jgi:hypothetical protein